MPPAREFPNGIRTQNPKPRKGANLECRLGDTVDTENPNAINSSHIGNCCATVHEAHGGFEGFLVAVIHASSPMPTFLARLTSVCGN